MGAFLTIAEVAERLRVGRTTVKTWIARRELASQRWGRLVRVREADLERFVEEHTLAAKAVLQ